MVQGDYRTGGSFTEKIESYLAEAKRLGWIVPESEGGTVFLFPEYLGFFLFWADESDRVYSARTIEAAAAWMALARIREFRLPAPGRDFVNRLGRALFRSKAQAAADLYQQAFSDLARRYGCEIIAGTICIPGPVLKDGRLMITEGGAFRNISLLFARDGTIRDAIIGKAYPTQFEIDRLDVESVSTGSMPLFRLKSGLKLGVAICADSWYPDTYASLHEADVIAVPAYSDLELKHSKPWKGYEDSHPGREPKDYSREDVQRPGFTERDAWLKYSLPTRIRMSRARQGMTVFLRGTMWNMPSDGLPMIVDEGRVVENAPSIETSSGETLVNLWLKKPAERKMQ
jgi:predicted amidohydrolase